MNRSGSETHRPDQRSSIVTRNARRLAAVTLIATATLATVHVDTAGAVVSCSLRVIARTDDTMALRYDPPDSIARTVWVDGQPHTIAPHDTAVVPAADTIMYPTLGDVIVVADIDVTNPSSPCSTTTTSTSSTTTTSSTSSTVPATTSTTDALTTITVVRTTPEPTTSTAPLPPATWTIVDTPTPVPGKRTALPETGNGTTVATVGLTLLALGVIALDIRRRDQRRRG